MKTIILCGGLGTRLKEETEFRPKPMVPIGNRPILWHIMKIYAHYGFNDFIVALGYKGDMIKDYFYHYELMNNDVTIKLGEKNRFEVHNKHDESGWNITLVNTGEKALKGARIKRLEKYIDGDEFMMTYGDGVANIDIHALMKFHQNHGKLVTMTATIPGSHFGELTLHEDREDSVKSFVEKPKIGSKFINGGFFVLKKDVLRYLYDDDQCDFEYGPIEQLAHEGQVKAYRHHGFWACMDNLRDMEHLNKLWSEGRAEWKIW